MLPSVISVSSDELSPVSQFLRQQQAAGGLHLPAVAVGAIVPPVIGSW